MLAETIRWVSHKVPNIRYVRSIPHRILKPMHKALRLQGGLVDVLGFKMHLDPNECVDSHLWFTPRSYDCQELDFLMHSFPDRGVFLDAGSNIGYWSLRFAQRFPNCRIYAIEANPATFDILSQNINVNVNASAQPSVVDVPREVLVEPRQALRLELAAACHVRSPSSCQAPESQVPEKKGASPLGQAPRTRRAPPSM